VENSQVIRGGGEREKKEKSSSHSGKDQKRGCVSSKEIKKEHEGVENERSSRNSSRMGGKEPKSMKGKR